ncbi:hypothetical protein HDF23_005702 [Mucilaginibacter lappiensis]|uniref:Uncharacterized protein n=1 Tax=Mucilaginibacter lappiensis TaxID=354630 RepID=A0ABR6PUT9_9SPHI|nr:hypothetical protein [Mucilaginibacter lappiensis]
MTLVKKTANEPTLTALERTAIPIKKVADCLIQLRTESNQVKI